MVLCPGGPTSIPPSLSDAAAMDGASTIPRVAVAGTLPDVTMPDADGVILVTEITKLAHMVAVGCAWEIVGEGSPDSAEWNRMRCCAE